MAPGELQNCFFINNGTDAIEGAMKLARLYTGKPWACIRYAIKIEFGSP